MNSFDELETFLTRWYVCTSADLAWDGPLPGWLRPDVAEFYGRFGELTSDAGFFHVDGLPPPLAAQDIITPVEELTRREDGSVILITENQSCWIAGQMPNSDELWSSIDLNTGETPYQGKQLFDMGFHAKEALLTHTLHETIMSAVSAGPAFDLAEWEAAEAKILSTGVVAGRRYITPDEGTLTIGWTDEYMASCWGAEEQFTWVVRKGDRMKGPRPTPYTVGRPRAARPSKRQGAFRTFFDQWF